MDIEVNLPADPSMHDQLLRAMVNEVRGTQLQIGITLMVGGFIVSRLVVSPHLFLENFRQEFAKMCQDGEVANRVQALCEEAENTILAPKSDDDPMPVYICLHDAEVHHPTNRGERISLGWWRGRISKIDGFRLGTLYEKKALFPEAATWSLASESQTNKPG